MQYINVEARFTASLARGKGLDANSNQLWKDFIDTITEISEQDKYNDIHLSLISDSVPVQGG